MKNKKCKVAQLRSRKILAQERYASALRKDITQTSYARAPHPKTFRDSNASVFLLTYKGNPEEKLYQSEAKEKNSTNTELLYALVIG